METLSELLAELESTGDDEATIEIAAEAMAQGETPREGLFRLLDHDLSSVRRAATLALGRRNDDEARPHLEARLEDASAEVRGAACLALAELSDDRSAARVCERLQDRMPGVRAAAARALRSFPSAATVEALAELLRREAALAPRRAAVETLAELCRELDTRSAARLVLATHIAREDDADLRAKATESLLSSVENLSFPELLVVFRPVPRSGRAALADSLEAVGPGTRAVLRLAEELRHLAADEEVLARFGSNLTRRAVRGGVPLALSRDSVLKQLYDRLTRSGPRSVVLVGPSGCGKTAIVHALAKRLAEAETLVPITIFEATTGEVLSGTRYLGEWQTRLKELTEALRTPQRVIWFVPDVNRLVEAGTSEHSQESFATMLAPALERGELVIVGESTPEAWRRGIDRFPVFKKLFAQVTLEVPDAERTLEILAGVSDRLAEEFAERDLDYDLAPGVLARAQELADDYFPSQARPGNAVRLLRESSEAAAQRVLDTAPDLSVGRATRTLRVEVGLADLLGTLSRLSGVPVHLLDDRVRLDLDEVRSFFAERVLGQEEAVETVVDLISMIKAGVTDPERPSGVLFFAGPTGVGKTEMAKALAEYIFGSSRRLVRVDLGEFREAHSIRRLVGDPHAPDPAARSGLLTASVRERPFSVVLLDEVEKAHDNVFDLLLPLLDEGRLVDELGRVTDFRRCIIVMTSNLGSDLSEGTDLGFGSSHEERQAQTAKVSRVMEKTFRPEFLNRLRSTVVFQPLTREVMRRLTRREARRVLSRKGITRREVLVELDDGVIGVLLEEGFSPHYGARYLKRRVEDLLLKPLARALHQIGPDDQAVLTLSVGRDQRLVSNVIVQDPDEDEVVEEPVARRVKDATGRLIDFDRLDDQVLDLTEQVEAIASVMEDQSLRQRKSDLLRLANVPESWEDPAKARTVMSEIAALERTLERPGHLDRALEGADRLLQRARSSRGKPHLVKQATERLDELAREIEFTTYAVHCPGALQRGDAFLFLRRVGEDQTFPEDFLAHMARMYRAYLRGKGLQVAVVYEAVTGRGRVRELALRAEGMCAYGLLEGEDGLHQWVFRDPNARHKRQSAFCRVEVLPPPERDLRATEINVERRRVRDVEGVLLKKHHQHLVLTHAKSQLAIDGSIDGHPQAEEGAIEFLSARVSKPRQEGERGVVRRYVISNSNQPTVRDLGTNVKLHLDQVLDGRLDDFILPRVLGLD
ncbi:MAG: AAA family ATPase [Planctomycetes bacterium]|nr:AAA family ATPase [Planctomycetota bacterium]